MILYKPRFSLHIFIIAHVLIHTISFFMYHKGHYNTFLFYSIFMETLLFSVLVFSFLLYSQKTFTFLFYFLDKPFFKVKKTDFRFFRIIKKQTSGKSYTGDAGSYSHSSPETFFSLEMVCKDKKHILDTFKSKKDAEYIKSKIEQKIRKKDAYKMKG